MAVLKCSGFLYPPDRRLIFMILLFSQRNVKVGAKLLIFRVYRDLKIRNTNIETRNNI